MRPFKVKIRDLAFIDLQEIVDYYNFKQKGLGIKFYRIFENSLNVLKTNPYFQIRFDNVRAIPLRTFPYTIYFTVDEKNGMVNIFSVSHQATDPDKIRQRAKI